MKSDSAGPGIEEPAPPAPGEYIGDYQLLARLGSGGMAAVYLGRRRGLAGFERRVAIKVCHNHLREDPDFVAMFLDEARLAAAIHHPNVVSTIDVRDDDKLYMVMDYVEGVALSALYRQARRTSQPLSPAHMSAIVSDALRGLQAAHEVTDRDGRPLKLIHRDVSPQNLIVGVDGSTRILDFGVAKAEARMFSTRGSVLKGKISYMAPEQLKSGVTSQKSDLFGMGVVLWEGLTGQRLFVGDTNADTIRLAISGPIRRPSAIVDGIPEPLDAMVMRALSRDPDQRFATAREMADALRGAVDPASPASVTELVTQSGELRPIPLVESGPPPDPHTTDDASTVVSTQAMGRRFSAKLAVAATATLVLVAAGAGVLLWDDSSSTVRDTAQDTPRNTTQPPSAPESATVATDTRVEEPTSPPGEVASSKLVRISSLPPGAAVSLSDGTTLGAAPQELARPEEGASIALTLKKRGYRSRSIRVTATSMAEWTVRLRKTRAGRRDGERHMPLRP